MSIINVSDVCEFINAQSSFEEIKAKCLKMDLYIREANVDGKDIFLIANNNDHRSYKKIVKKENVIETEILNETAVESTETLIELGLDDETISRIKIQANGIIFEKGTNKVVCMCQNKMKEIDSFDDVMEIVRESYANMRVEYCEDGTLVRLYHYNNDWHTATTRCIDAKISKWSGNKDFDTMFWEVFGRDLLSDFDKDYTYLFVLLHRENRIVVRHNVNMLVFVSRINNNSFQEEYVELGNNTYGIKTMKTMNQNEFQKLMNNPNVYDFKFKRGILLKVFDRATSSFTVSKYDFESYRMIKSIRGNVPEIRMRFLELLSKPESLQLLEKFYSEHTFMFTFIKASLLKLVKTVYKLYVDSHIKHVVKVTDENIYYRTLRQLHAQYKITNKPIGFDDVRAKINSLDKMVIKKLLGWE
jgi:hypothetical protein